MIHILKYALIRLKIDLLSMTENASNMPLPRCYCLRIVIEHFLSRLLYLSSVSYRHERAMELLDKLNTELADNVNRERELQAFIDTLSTCTLILDAWDEQLWRLLVAKGGVGKDGKIEFEFRGRKKIKNEAAQADFFIRKKLEVCFYCNDNEHAVYSA